MGRRRKDRKIKKGNTKINRTNERYRDEAEDDH